MLAESLTEILESNGLGIARLDVQGRILKLNRPARRMLQDGDILIQTKRRLLIIVDPKSDVDIDPALVELALSLTPKEASVAVMLAQGKNVLQIAALTNRSEGTIRKQVKSIFMKLGLSRQTELVILVRSLSVIRWL